VGAALVLPTGTAFAETLPADGGCEQDPVICQSGVPLGEAPAVKVASERNATGYTIVGVGAGVVLLAGGAVVARRRRSTLEV